MQQPKPGSFAKYPIDVKFISLIDDFKTLSEMQIYHLMIGRFRAFHAETRVEFEDYCRSHPFWGSLNDEKNDYQVFRNRASALHHHWVDLLWFYSELSDFRSRYILYALVNNWYYYDVNSLSAVRESLYPPYFDMEIFKCTADEVFVDIGASDGASIMKYISTYNNFKRIYCYETLPEKLALLSEKFKNNEKIIVRDIKHAYIDEDISEPITLLKISADGLEQKALTGCLKHIKDDKPKLAVSLHNNNDNLWEIPRALRDACPGYKFYLRYHGKSFYPTDLALLSIFPPSTS